MEVIRYKIEHTKTNGLKFPSQVMIDKIMQVEKIRVQKIAGHITKKQIEENEARMLAILGVK